MSSFIYATSFVAYTYLSIFDVSSVSYFIAVKDSDLISRIQRLSIKEKETESKRKLETFVRHSSNGRGLQR